MADSIWTEEFTASIVQQYLDAEPTAETTSEIIKEIAEDNDVSPNGVRMKLIKAEVYVKVPTAASKTTKAAASGGTKRVSKEAAIKELTDAITAAEKEVNEEILSKLTGKAAVYVLTLLK